MFAPPSATAIAPLVAESRCDPCWTLTVATTTALVSAMPAIIAKRAKGSAMPRSLRAIRTRWLRNREIRATAS